MKGFNIKSMLTTVWMLGFAMTVLNRISFTAAALLEDDEKSIDLLMASGGYTIQEAHYKFNEWDDEAIEESLLSNDDDVNIIAKKEALKVVETDKVYRDSLKLFRKKAMGIDNKYKHVVDSKSGIIYRHDTGTSVSCSTPAPEAEQQEGSGPAAAFTPTSACQGLINRVQANIHVLCSPTKGVCVVSNPEVLVAQQKVGANKSDVVVPPEDDSRKPNLDDADATTSSTTTSSSYYRMFNKVHSEYNGEAVTCTSSSHCDEAALCIKKPLYCGVNGYCKVGVKDNDDDEEDADDIYCELNFDCFEAGSYDMECDYPTNTCVSKITIPVKKEDENRDNIITHIIRKASFTQQVLLGVSLCLAMISGCILIFEYVKVRKNQTIETDDEEEDDAYLYESL